MSVSVLVLSLLVVAGLQSVDGRRLERRSKVSVQNWDAVKGVLEKENEVFIAEHSGDLKDSLTLMRNVWAAMAKYNRAIGNDASAQAIEDANTVINEEMAGKAASDAEVSKMLAESDAGVDDAAEAIAIMNALVHYVAKKEPKKGPLLEAQFKKEVGQIAGV